MAVESSIISWATKRSNLERQLLQIVRSAICIIGSAAYKCTASHSADILILNFLHHKDIWAVQVVDNLGGNIVKSRLIYSITGRNVIIRRINGSQERRHLRATSIASEIATREWVITIIVQVLHVVVNDTVLGVAIRHLRSMIGAWIESIVEGWLRADLDAVFIERVVESARNRS